MSDEPNSRGGSTSRFGSGSTGDNGQGGIFEPGSLISFTYEVESLLARGGMGEVYRTRHTEIGTEHAIKIVRPDLANNDKIMELFRREASVLRTVRDDAIVGYDGVLRDEEGRVYLVMEYVDGPSLTTFIEDRVLTLEEVRHLRDRLARGLAAAHDKGVIHRDMSPDNIILGNGDLAQAKIIDFGIAKLADSSATTIIGDDFAGRYAYASPEQIGLYGGQVDARSDIYSLGLVLATSATGKALNMGEISESLVSVIEARKRIPDFSSVPEELRPELGSMLEPDPADRPQSMRDVVGLDQKLRGAGEGEPRERKPAEAEKPAAAAAPAPAAAPQPSLAAEPASRPAAASQGKKTWLVPAMAAGIAVIAAGGYFAWHQSGQAPQAPVAQAPSPAPAKPAAEAVPQAAESEPTAVAEAPAPAEELASGEVAPASGPAPAEEQVPEQQVSQQQAVEEAKAAEEARLAAEAKAAEEERLAAEAKAAEEAKGAEEARLAAGAG
uniref:serine/threonine-protein kinase n=1 Tax=Pelagibius marinus TaxID=2762760 RepID=UPI0018728636